MQIGRNYYVAGNGASNPDQTIIGRCADGGTGFDRDPRGTLHVSQSGARSTLVVGGIDRQARNGQDPYHNQILVGATAANSSSISLRSSNIWWEISNTKSGTDGAGLTFKYGSAGSAPPASAPVSVNTRA